MNKNGFAPMMIVLVITIFGCVGYFIYSHLFNPLNYLGYTNLGGKIYLTDGEYVYSEKQKDSFGQDRFLPPNVVAIDDFNEKNHLRSKWIKLIRTPKNKLPPRIDSMVVSKSGTLVGFSIVDDKTEQTNGAELREDYKIYVFNNQNDKLDTIYESKNGGSLYPRVDKFSVDEKHISLVIYPCSACGIEFDGPTVQLVRLSDLKNKQLKGEIVEFKWKDSSNFEYKPAEKYPCKDVAPDGTPLDNETECLKDINKIISISNSFDNL